MIRFTKRCGTIPPGSVAKAFVDDDLFDSSYRVLNNLLDVKAFSGLGYRVFFVKFLIWV